MKKANLWGRYDGTSFVPSWRSKKEINIKHKNPEEFIRKEIKVLVSRKSSGNKFMGMF